MLNIGQYNHLEVIKKVEPHDSIERYESLGVECVTGEARITSPWSVATAPRLLRNDIREIPPLHVPIRQLD